MHGASLHQDGKKIEVMIFAKKEEREDQGEKYTNLFVQNLPIDFSEDQLKDIFAEFGDIDSASMNHQKSGSGFVSFKEHA